MGGLTEHARTSNAIAPALNPATTVDGLLKSLQDGDLIRIDLGVATARNAGDLQSYISQAVSEGGAIDILPNLLGSGKSLLKINILKSTAKVSVDRNTMKVMPEADAHHSCVSRALCCPTSASPACPSWVACSARPACRLSTASSPWSAACSVASPSLTASSAACCRSTPRSRASA